MNGRRQGRSLSLLLGCLLFVVGLRCEAQINLVPNPGFEEMDTCEQVLGFFTSDEGPAQWFTAWGTPDHLIGCLPYGAANGSPLNVWTFQEPYEGSSCVGIYTYHQSGMDQQREWIMVPLLQPLTQGQEYFCSFRANAAFGGNAQYPQIWVASNNVGMHFSTINRQWLLGDPYPAYSNQAHVNNPEILSDTSGWILVSGSFVADSAYQYLMIGNFFSNALTDTLHFASPESVVVWYPRGYTLIDDVCVSAYLNGCDLGTGLDPQRIDRSWVYPNPAAERITMHMPFNTMVHVYDPLGREVWQGLVMSGGLTLDVASWARGNYILRSQDGKSHSVQKFMLIE